MNIIKESFNLQLFIISIKSCLSFHIIFDHGVLIHANMGMEWKYKWILFPSVHHFLPITNFICNYRLKLSFDIYNILNYELTFSYTIIMHNTALTINQHYAAAKVLGFVYVLLFCAVLLNEFI